MTRLPSGERGAFAENAQHSFTLPSRYYTDPDIRERELRGIFQRSWLYVGHESDIANAGDYLTDDIAGQPVLVVRAEDDGLRGFFNVCQHRGHILVTGRGNLKSRIVCPYHAWCYGLDGALKTARLTKDVAGFDAADFSLKPLGLHVAAGMIFVNLDPTASPDDGELGAFGASILEHLPEMPDYIARHRFDFDIAANWKVVVDNFSEGYHIPVAHPHLATLYNEHGSSATVGNRFAAYVRSARAGFADFETTGDEPYRTWFLWPNLCILSLPGSPQLIVVRMSPGAHPGQCLEHADIYCPPSLKSPKLDAVTTLFSEIFNREDISLVENVQRGLASLGYDQGRYVVDRDDSWFSESALHRFHRQILDAIDEGE